MNTNIICMSVKKVNLMRMNEKGFTVVNWILGLLIVLVIAFGGYFLYQNIPGEAENLDLVLVDAPVVDDTISFLEVA